MSKRDEIVKNLKDDQDKILVVKIIDSIEQVQKYFEPRFTQFLDPAQVSKSLKVLDQYSGIKYMVSCGIQNCERNVISIFPDYMEYEEISIPVNVLRITSSSRFENINHRDILGALMSLGIKREKIGDIFLNNSRYYILSYSDISSYISMNLDKIKHSPVKVEYVDFKDVPEKQQEYKLLTSNVSSLRLDSICSAGYGESRSSVSGLITSGDVKVNWEEVRDLSFKVCQGDVISLKGKGRVILDAIVNETKKGRINIIIKKIL